MKKHVSVIAVPRSATIKQVMHHNLFEGSHISGFARDLAKTLAMVICPDGETSKGEQKYRHYTSQEIVIRAVDIAALMHDEFIKRGWIAESVPTDELIDDSKPVGFTTK